MNNSGSDHRFLNDALTLEEAERAERAEWLQWRRGGLGCAIGEEVFVGGRWLCVARRSVDHVELVDLDTGSTIAWPANQPIERQVRRP